MLYVHPSAKMKRSISLGHNRSTSISLNEAFWNRFREIAREKGMTYAQLIEYIRTDQPSVTSLTRAVRRFLTANGAPTL